MAVEPDVEHVVVLGDPRGDRGRQRPIALGPQLARGDVVSDPRRARVQLGAVFADDGGDSEVERARRTCRRRADARREHPAETSVSRTDSERVSDVDLARLVFHGGAEGSAAPLVAHETSAPRRARRLRAHELIVCERDEKSGLARIRAIDPADEEEIMTDSPFGLGEVWFSGALGGGFS